MEKRRFQIWMLVLILGSTWLCSLSGILGTNGYVASNYDRTFTYNVQYGSYLYSHRLYVSVPPSLHDYYRSESHSVYRDSDYSKFVTPEAVRSIAESIRTGIGNKPYGDEEFANTVLMLVRQISYVKSSVKYPVETLVDNSGDCDVLSLLAASIMKAGGLDVVLLYYKGLSPPHMNVGVYLSYTPVYRSWWITPTCYEHDGKKFWMAECTSKGEWKVGDRPDLYNYLKPQIISLEECEKSSPAQVSSSLDDPLIPSSISITVSPENSSDEEKTPILRISGLVSPNHLGNSVVMYVGKDGLSLNTVRKVVTDGLGNYSFTWNLTSTGTYHFRTSWSGDSNCAGSDSETLTIFVGFYQPQVKREESEHQVNVAPPGYFIVRRSGRFPLFALVQLSSEPKETSLQTNEIDYEIFAKRGVKEFLKIDLSGTGVFLSGEFIILSNVQSTVNQIAVNQTFTNQFGFLLQNNGGNNYSVSVKGLDDYDTSRITKRLYGNNTAFMNASSSTMKNTWYKVSATMSDKEITVELYDENNTLLKNMSIKDDAINIDEFNILMPYDLDSVIAFKNLKIEILDQPAKPVEYNNIPLNALDSLAPYIALLILLALAFSAVVLLKKKSPCKHSFPLN